jgi:glycosyltransferase involved in cell wall biosynthesis
MKLLRVTTVPSSLAILLRRQLLFMQQNGFEVVAISADGKEVADIVRNEQCKHLVIPMTRTIAPLSDLRAVISMYKIIRREKPDIVHSHTPKAGIVAMLASYLARVPVRMHTVAGLPLMEAKGTKRKLLNIIEKLTYACASKIYPNSKNQARFIIEHGFTKPKKIKVLGNGSSNGIDTEYYHANPDIIEQSKQLKTKLGISHENFVFIFVGRLVKDKGIGELVQAFKEIQKKYSFTRLLLLGEEEPELDSLKEETIREIKGNENIIPVGFQKDIRPFLALSNVLVFPSYREGFPNVPMQAGCFNLPSIVTNINGCNEIIEDMKNGLIVPVKDANALLSAMERLITDKEAYFIMKENARKMIVERYEQRIIWKLLLEEYQTQLKNVS